MAPTFRIEQLRGQLRYHVDWYMEHYDKIDIKVDEIRTATLRSNLQDGKASVDSQIKALAISIWLDKNGYSIEGVAHHPDLVKRLASKIYTSQRACNVIDNRIFKTIGLHWHDLFPISIPSKAAISKLATLAWEIVRWCPPMETKVGLRIQLRGLVESLSPAPTAYEITLVLKEWRKQNELRINSFAKEGDNVDQEDGSEVSMDEKEETFLTNTPPSKVKQGAEFEAKSVTDSGKLLPTDDAQPVKTGESSSFSKSHSFSGESYAASVGITSSKLHSTESENPFTASATELYPLGNLDGNKLWQYEESRLAMKTQVRYLQSKFHDCIVKYRQAEEGFYRTKFDTSSFNQLHQTTDLEGKIDLCPTWEQALNYFQLHMDSLDEVYSDKVEAAEAERERVGIEGRKLLRELKQAREELFELRSMVEKAPI